MSITGSILKDRYEIISELGRGGMSTVYLARDKNLGSYWAVKQVQYNKSGVDIEAFKKEVELLSSLSHSDIPRIVDRIEMGDNYFVCMDFIDGVALGNKVKQEGPQSEKDVIDWAKSLCDVLDYLHNVRENPIVYRDMKPDNVMLTASGRLKLVDFGIAKECIRGKKLDGPKVGTKGYAAPEQYVGGPLDERTDIYSLGATLYYLLTGQVASEENGRLISVRQINPLLSEGVDYVITKCLQRQPEDRYQSCKELLNDLKNIGTLNSKYRNTMKRKIVYFAASVVMFFVFLFCTILGYNGMKKDNKSNYDKCCNEASAYEKNALLAEQQEDYVRAREQYIEAGDSYKAAIKYYAKDSEVYIKMYNALSPKDYSSDYLGELAIAVNALREYADEKGSQVYSNSDVLYILIKDCIELRNYDARYADFATEYIARYKKTDEYSKSQSKQQEIDSLEVISMAVSSTNKNSGYLEKLQSALTDLEENTSTSSVLTLDEKLENYYILINLYTQYPSDLENPYDKIANIGEIAKEIIDSNADTDTLTFSNIIPMYETVASSKYEQAMLETDVNNERAYLEDTLVWFGYLDDLAVTLDDTLSLKKANTYREIFNTYNNVNDRDKIDSNIQGYLDKALEIYNKILKNDSNNFLAHIYITQVYISKELVKNEDQRDYTNVISSYNQVTQIQTTNDKLTTKELSLFSSLKKQMETLGLGE